MRRPGPDVAPARRPLAALALAALALPTLAWTAGCATTGADDVAERATLAPGALVPRLGGDPGALAALDGVELEGLRLIATNLVSALVQIPELAPGVATLQVNRPDTAFGNAVVRALEDAGYGLQLVADDRGRHYVGYARRVAETEIGEVVDYRLAVGEVALTREFAVEDDGSVFPASLLRIEGVDPLPAIELADGVFREQGGTPRSFVSGTRGIGGTGGAPTIDTVEVFDYDALPPERRTAPVEVLARSRERGALAADAAATPDLDDYVRHRRTVLIFEDPDTSFLGAPNKRAVRLLAREVVPGDLFVIRSCRDFDGEDAAAMRRGLRVEEELVGLGVAPEATWIAPCVGSNYRHASDDSPVPVELFHYRRRAAAGEGAGPAAG